MFIPWRAAHLTIMEARETDMVITATDIVPGRPFSAAMTARNCARTALHRNAVMPAMRCDLREKAVQLYMAGLLHWARACNCTAQAKAR